MGRPINRLRKAGLIIKINREGYSKLIQLARTVVERMTAAVATYATPTPALATITTAADDLRDAAAKMGIKRNRASKAERLDTQLKATTLRNLLIAELTYAVNTCLIASGSDIPTFNSILIQSGFSEKDIRSLNAQAQIPTFVSQTNTKLHPGTQGRLKWKRPIGLIKGAKVAGYNITIGGVIKLTTTKTNILVPVTPGVNVDVQIVPFNSRGTGQAFSATIKGLS